MGFWSLDDKLLAKLYTYLKGWLHAKLLLVILLSIYHLACGKFRLKLAQNPHYKSHVYWRWFNEIPVVILIAVVILVIVKPF